MPNKNSTFHLFLYNRYFTSILCLHCSNTLIVLVQRRGGGGRNKGIETENKNRGNETAEKVEGTKTAGKGTERNDIGGET